MHLSKLQKCTEILHKRFNTWHPKKPHSKSSFPWHWLVKGDIWVITFSQEPMHIFQAGFFLCLLWELLPTKAELCLAKPIALGAPFRSAQDGWSCEVWRSTSLEPHESCRLRCHRSHLCWKRSWRLELTETQGLEWAWLNFYEFFNIFLGVMGSMLGFHIC